MPELPIYDSQQSIQTGRVGASVRPEMAAPARALQGLGATLEKIGDHWHKAHVNNQYTKAKNATDLEIKALVQAAENEPDHSPETMKIYADKLKEIRSRDHAIDDIDVKAEWDANSGHAVDSAGISIDGMFKQKLIANQGMELLQDGDSTKSSYINLDHSASPNEGRMLKSGYKERLKASFDTGVINAKVYASELAEIDEWDTDRVEADIEKNPVVAMAKLDAGHYGKMDSAKINKLHNLAKATVIRQREIKEISNLRSYAVNQPMMSKLVYGNDDDEVVIDGVKRRVDSFTFGEKLEILKDWDGQDKIGDEFAGDLIASVTQKQKNYPVNNKLFARTTRMIASANFEYDTGEVDEAIPEDETPFEKEQRLKRADDITTNPSLIYLRKIDGIQRNIMKMKISPAEKKRLLNLLTTKVTENQVEATREVAGHKDFMQADEEFKDDIPLFQDEALREYAIETAKPENQGMKDHHKKKLINSIKQKIYYRNSTKILSRYTEVDTRFANDKVDIVQNKKTGEFSFAVYRRGYPKPKKILLDKRKQKALEMAAAKKRRGDNYKEGESEASYAKRDVISQYKKHFDKVGYNRKNLMSGGLAPPDYVMEAFKDKWFD